MDPNLYLANPTQGLLAMGLCYYKNDTKCDESINILIITVNRPA